MEFQSYSCKAWHPLWRGIAKFIWNSPSLPAITVSRVSSTRLLWWTSLYVGNLTGKWPRLFLPSTLSEFSRAQSGINSKPEGEGGKSVQSTPVVINPKLSLFYFNSLNAVFKSRQQDFVFLKNFKGLNIYYQNSAKNMYILVSTIKTTLVLQFANSLICKKQKLSKFNFLHQNS